MQQGILHGNLDANVHNLIQPGEIVTKADYHQQTEIWSLKFAKIHL